MKRLCVFCGSRVGRSAIYEESTRLLGSVLVQRGITLVYGAGHVGLMGTLADAVLSQGGQVLGAIPRNLVERELAHQGLTELHIVESMHDRKALMASLADAFLALPGGFGTLDELFEILTWAQLKLHHRPIGILNVAGFFDLLLAWIDRAVADDFLKPHYRELLLVDSMPERLLDRLDQAITSRGLP